MSSKSIISEEDKIKYEKEFSDFLIQKINHTGGSIQFQHLSGVVQQLRFELREEFGASKKEIMKFLKAHPKIFKIDSKGLVTLVPSAPEDCASSNIVDKREIIKSGKTKHLKIENGMGVVEKLSDEFGFIEAIDPFKTTVFFTSLEYCGKKDALLTELSLSQNSKVYFNAIYGHHDFEVEYRATKVWPCNLKKGDKSAYSDNYKNKESIIKLKGEDDISLYGKANEVADTTITDCDKNSKNHLQSIEISKKSRPLHNQLSSPVVTTGKDSDIKKILENEKGKIYPFSGGANIKFGKDYSKVASGNLCEYFLYGARVSDIDWEFSEGDDIFFDAIESKIGWKASLAWVGEKPDITISIKTHIEEKNEICEDQNCRSISDVSSETSYSSAKSRTRKSKFSPFSTECSVKKENKSSCHDFEQSKSKSIVQNGKFKKSKCKSKNKKNSDINPLDSYQNSSEDDKEFQFKKGNKYDFTPRFKFKGSSDDESINSDGERNSCETNTLEDPTNSMRNKASVMQFKEIDGEVVHLYCKIAIVSSSHLQREVDFVCSTFYLNGKPLDEYNVVDLKEVIQVRDIIKFNCFEIIDDNGDIHQKVTMAWKNGPKPVPVMPEMTPEEFIAESGLSVSVSYDYELGNEHIQEHITAQNSIFTSQNCTSSDDTSDFDSQTKTSLQIALEDMKDASENDMLQYPVKTSIINEKRDESKVYCKFLSDRIIQILKRNGFTSSDPKGDLNIAASDIINLILENCNIKGTLNPEVASKGICLRESSEVLCSNCAKRSNQTKNMTTDAKVQTIITGEIVATSIYTQT